MSNNKQTENTVSNVYSKIDINHMDNTNINSNPPIPESVNQIVMSSGMVTPSKKDIKKNKGQPVQKKSGGHNMSSKKSSDSTKSSKKTYSESKVLITSLGGMEEIGKNMFVFEYEQEMIIVDCGLSFPDNELLGIDYVIPDLTYVIENNHKIKGLVLTHGHEDHIGAVPYLLKEIDLPVYGTSLTLGLVEAKLNEHNMTATLHPIYAGDRIALGCFTIEPVRVNHSIPDSVALAIETPAGVIIHTGDFKIDYTPIVDEVIDLRRFAELGSQGVLLLLSDSTNAEKTGNTISESVVGEGFEKLFHRAAGKRIVIASFASNIQRIQQIVDLAIKHNRKIAISGRSMESYTAMAEKLGYLDFKEGILIGIEKVSNYRPEDIIIITTGSQGEPMSALTRMANGTHRQINIDSNDFVIISANPVPGNETMVYKIINELYKLGSEVIYESMYEVHASGHACRDDLKMLINLVNPKFFIPVHGEYRQLVKHKEIALSMGVKSKNILIPSIGQTVELTEKSIRHLRDVPSGRVLVDGLGVGDVGSVVLRDRQRLSQEGLLVVVCTLDESTNEILSGPDLLSRGFVFVRESEELFDEIKQTVNDILERRMSYSPRRARADLNLEIREEVSSLLYKRTKRNPMILPMILDI